MSSLLDISVLGQRQRGLLQLSVQMVKDYSWVYPASFEEHLKMQVLGSGPASTSCESYYLSGLYLVSNLDKVL